ncbi:Gfo/Idh/MocA family protein [Dyadobacter fanqingshengii]|uniref:Gfo/Idh/MocA family oxidoreductase n=1 Tax=Dyadobacter fanqingshengii TaxID=2906443 RepID=A0A9X1PA31_9BACT|nr:Gfo/Idh/MocA family oxidoreductase [Dyadobacter fanqingshengii]MCF0039540.1 Gfo/Idh/MocA family oxidoreductase [Dyadobacter fanqingshengii]MCF2502920.1 Gfo/Idh/MocA family oxidoreductase [Dyadobacter fanqingshengii]USJ38731.1 Gfo/Idh/MocA family oxidoreductase [Dyadobacter fanqingshengii]
MGMVGGSLDAFIGGVHRRAAIMDGEIELVCGVFSSDPSKSKETGRALYLPEDRLYNDFEEMILKEKQLPEGERMDFVAIVTPNHMHKAPTKLALENGFHVVCDKPITLNTEEAEEITALVEKTGLIFCLTHNYTGYPMVKEAKHMIASGAIGKIRKVIVEYPQGWLATLVEVTGNKQAAWRTDPKRSGAAGGLGDIGTHAENLAEYITGLRITQVCADLTIFVEGRLLDDDANILLRFDNGAKGILQNSQIANGEENDLNIRVYGETGGLQWKQLDPNTLIHKTNQGARIIRTGVGNLSKAAQVHTRIPAGHPEGYFEAFANLYRNFAFHLRARWEGRNVDPVYDFPSAQDGLRGMKFIDAVIASNASDTKWTNF